MLEKWKVKNKSIAGRTLLVSLLSLVVVLLITLFPFDWLSTTWPLFGQMFDRVFVSALSHEIGHIVMFLIAGLLMLWSAPLLRVRPLWYFGGMVLVALGQEGIQSLFKRELPNIYDGRDVLNDLIGVTIAFLIVWGWQRSRRAKGRLKLSKE